MALADTHAHLDDEAFAADLPAVMERAAAAGVTTVVAIGTDAGSSRRVIALAEQHPQVHASVGIHPHEAGTAPPEAVRDLTAGTDHPRGGAGGGSGVPAALSLPLVRRPAHLPQCAAAGGDRPRGAAAPHPAGDRRAVSLTTSVPRTAERTGTSPSRRGATGERSRPSPA